MTKKTNYHEIYNDWRVSSIEEDLIKWSGEYQNKGGDGFPLTQIATYIVSKALYSWFIKQDLNTAKQYFHVAAKLIAVSTTKPRGETFWGLHPFMFPLLSDNAEMIAHYATLSPQSIDDKPSFAERRNDLKSNEFDIYLVQLALQKDDAKLQECLTAYKAKNYKRQSKEKAGLIQFMEALLKGDVAQMESAIAPLGEWEKANPTTEDFLSDYAVVLCKLAWLRGYEVQVDSSLVPMAFMPTAPLAHYDDVYDFLKPNWQAPPPHASPMTGLFAKLFGKKI